jgi:uncharacterized cupredoxin-like copper-binding protein
MSRSRVVFVAVLAFVMLLAPGIAGQALAQGAQSGADAGHPLVGSWVTLAADDPSEPPSITMFGPGGSVSDVGPDGSVGLGAWESTGPSTADASIWYPAGGGVLVIRAAIEVAADGQSFTGTYTVEMAAIGGEGSGQHGPAEIIGTRIPAEGPGEPVGPMQDLLPEAATPVADTSDTTINVELFEFGFEADQLTLTAGVEYTFLATNTGLLVHEMVIEPAGAVDEPLERDDVESEIEDIEPGSTAELTWTFDEPGRYQFSCHIPGHFESGMVLEFEVVAP